MAIHSEYQPRRVYLNYVPLSPCALLTFYQRFNAYSNGGTFTKNTRHSLLSHKRSHTKLLPLTKATY